MISRQEIDGLAELARLKLSNTEAEGLQKDISNILDYIGQISTTETTIGAEAPLLRNIMREDVPRGEGDPMADKRDALLKALPRREGDFAVVRKIIQKDE